MEKGRTTAKRRPIVEFVSLLAEVLIHENPFPAPTGHALLHVRGDPAAARAAPTLVYPRE